LVALLAAGSVWYHLELRPVNPHGSSQLFTVQPGQRTPAIAANLQSDGLIRSKDAFITYLGLHGLRGKLKAGIFRLSPAESSVKVANILTANGPGARQLTVIPGDTLAQIEALAASQGISQADFAAALTASHSQPVLDSKPADVSLEGYLYPDTYGLGPTVTASSLVDMMINNLAAHVTPQMEQKFAVQGLSFHQALTLASILEKEVSGSADQAKAAQVFLKRLQVGMPLESDVTAAYAQSVGNPAYNTYLNKGLPPGPICSPGIGALNAVANPANTDYLYFYSAKNGTTYFEQTYAQHQADIQKYGQ